MDFEAIRKEYENQGIDEKLLPNEPISLLREWYQLAVEKRPGKWLEPNAMSLATADRNGHVTNRYVLLKSIEDDGLRFFTNYESTKGQQLSANPRAAVALHWPYLGRQIRVEGQVEKTSRVVSEAYFHSRPRGSQLGAAASQQSAVIESRSDLDQQRKRLDIQFKDQLIPLPDNWGGYLLKPSLIEFWQGRLDRLHDRIVYEFDGSWDWNRRSP